MNLPSGLIFYLDFKYGTAQPGFDNDNNLRSGDPFGSTNADDSLFGVTTTTGDPSGGLYGAGRFGYSLNSISSSILAATSIATGSTPTVAQVNGDSAYSGSTQFKMVTVNIPTDADLYAVRSFTLVAAGTELFPVQAFSSIDSNFTASLVVSGSTATSIQAAITAGTIRLNYTKQPEDTSRGDFEDKTTYGNGYNVVCIFYNKKKYTKRLGKVIWQSFNECDCVKTIDHIDRNRANNNYQNPFASG